MPAQSFPAITSAILHPNVQLYLGSVAVCVQVVHSWNPTCSIQASYPIEYLATYSDLVTAQAAAYHTLEQALAEYRRRGYRGRYYKDIDLRTRGLITAYVGRSEEPAWGSNEIWLSEILIRIVEQPPTPRANWNAGSEDGKYGHGSGAQEMNNNPANVKVHSSTVSKQRPTIRLPASKASRPAIRSGKLGKTTHQIPEEKTHWTQKHMSQWSQTRIPWPSKRAKGPFRAI